MRMDRQWRSPRPPSWNTWPEAELGAFCSASMARRGTPGALPRAIVFRRGRTPYTRTCELVDTIKSAIPTPARFGAGNPARRVFQALRIEVKRAEQPSPRTAARLLPPRERGSARLHQFSTPWKTGSSRSSSRVRPRALHVPARVFPCGVCGGKSTGELLTSRPISPGAHELELNPRSSSAKLRALRRI